VSDIFISYSSKDRKQAMTLVKHLQTSGFKVWIDKKDIQGASEWSSEIVQAIEHSKVVIVLLSRSGLASDNVGKELTLASAKHKKLLPVTLEHISLTDSFQYHLAGIQHIVYKEYDQIERTVHRLLAIEQRSIIKLAPRIVYKKGVLFASFAGIAALSLIYLFLPSSEQSLIPETSQQTSSHEMIRLAVLKFEDRSGRDKNTWLSDGLMDWLLTSLGSMENMYVPSRSDVLYHGEKGVEPDELAATLHVRYTIVGSVRDSANLLSLDLSLYDMHQQQEVWNKHFQGKFSEIFLIQNRVLYAILTALKIMPPEGIRSSPETDSPEAYALYLKGLACYRKHTREGYDRSIEFREKALRLDPQFVLAHLGIANTCQEYYYRFSQETEFLKRAEKHLSVAASIEGETQRIYQLRSIIALRSGDPQRELQLVQ
jgi:TolB-like protein